MEDVRRRSMSVRQLELLINYMEGHRDLALGRVRSREARAVANRHWLQIAEILNSEGNCRTTKEWTKFWNDYKCRVRTKTIHINKSRSGTGGGPNMAPELTPLESRVASLIGRDIGPLPGVRIDPVIEVDNVNVIPIQEVLIQSNDSPVMDISNFLLDRDITPPLVEDVAISNTPVVISNKEEENVQPSTSQSQPPPDETERRTETNENQSRRRLRRPSNPNLRRNTSDLDEARAQIARIEEIRARTEATQAEILLIHARTQENLQEIGLQVINLMQNIAQSIRMFAESYTERNTSNK